MANHNLPCNLGGRSRSNPDGLHCNGSNDNGDEQKRIEGKTGESRLQRKNESKKPECTTRVRDDGSVEYNRTSGSGNSRRTHHRVSKQGHDNLDMLDGNGSGLCRNKHYHLETHEVSTSNRAPVAHRAISGRPHERYVHEASARVVVPFNRNSKRHPGTNVTTHPYYQRPGRRGRSEWLPGGCNPGSPWIAGSLRFGNTLRRTFGCGSIPTLSA